MRKSTIFDFITWNIWLNTNQKTQSENGKYELTFIQLKGELFHATCIEFDKLGIKIKRERNK